MICFSIFAEFLGFPRELRSFGGPFLHQAFVGKVSVAIGTAPLWNVVGRGESGDDGW